MGIHWSRLILLGLVVWSALGVAGVAISRRRGERERVRRGLMTLGTVWVVYVAVLAGCSWRQPTRVYAPGEERCFGDQCFAVRGAEEVQGFLVRGQERERLLRVAVLIRNRGGGPGGEAGLQALLIDAQGRRWSEVTGLSGVRLTTRLPGGGSTVSEPVFRVARDATGLRLLLWHPGWTRARLTIGDPESYGHRPAELLLPSAPGRP